MIFIQTISVKSYLLKYLSHSHSVDPFVLTERNRYGLFILKSLRHSHIIRTNKYSIQGKTVPMKILIKEHYERSYGINISIMDQYHFNSMLLDEFHDKMLSFVSYRYHGRKGDIKMALHAFCEFYDISEDELPFRTLQKMWERQGYRLSSYISVQ